MLNRYPFLLENCVAQLACTHCKPDSNGAPCAKQRLQKAHLIAYNFLPFEAVYSPY